MRTGKGTVQPVTDVNLHLEIYLFNMSFQGCFLILVLSRQGLVGQEGTMQTQWPAPGQQWPQASSRNVSPSEEGSTSCS